MEKLTDLDCVMIDNINILEKLRRKVGGPSICGSNTQDIGKFWFDGDDKDKPIMVYRGDTGDRSDPIGDENAVLAEIYDRCGDKDIAKRKRVVQQERLYRIWGGKAEYYKTFPWLQGGDTPHSDADVVDNCCTECGLRGLPKHVVRCSRCRRGEF
jgi:hypothetical protein